MTTDSSVVSLPWTQPTKRRLTHYMLLVISTLAIGGGLISIAVGLFTDLEGDNIGAGFFIICLGLCFILIGFGPWGTLGRVVTIDRNGVTVGHGGWRIPFLYRHDTDSPRLRLTPRRTLPADQIERYYHATSGDPLKVVPHKMAFRPSHHGNPIAARHYYLTRDSSDGIMIKQRNGGQRPWWFIHCEDPAPFLNALEQCRDRARQS